VRTSTRQSIGRREGGELQAVESLRDLLASRERAHDCFWRRYQRRCGGGVGRVLAIRWGFPSNMCALGGLFKFARRYDLGINAGRWRIVLRSDSERAGSWMCCGWSVRNPLKARTLAASIASVVGAGSLHDGDRKTWRISCCRPRRFYEKNGSVTNATGEVQRLKAAAKVMGTKSDSKSWV